MNKPSFRYKDPKGFLFNIDLDELAHIKPKEYNTWEYCGQNTNLKDKNGKEVYEGDIIRVVGGDLREVFWCRGGYWSWYGMISNSEVVGNIYQNPELLRTRIVIK